jgi:hypothetical protein
MNKDYINKRNTREWVKCNEDSNSKHWRSEFVKEHGGSFTRKKKMWVWKNERQWVHVQKKGLGRWVHVQEKEKIVEDTRLRQTRKEYVFINKDGVEFLTDNFTTFCKKNNLNRAAMHQVENGKRPQHKGFTVTKLPPKEE